jgi:hypothetical protein
MTSESQIIIYGPTVNLTERKSALNNNIQEVVTVGDLKGYKTYTALLTQSGTSSGVVINGSDAIVSGVTYEIAENPSNVDLTSIGAPNNNVGTFFIANQNVEPNTFPSNLNLAYDEGKPVVTVLEDNIGMDLHFLYLGVGNYSLISNGSFPVNKTFVLVGSTVSPSSILKSYRVYNEYVAVKSYSSGSTLANGILNKTPLEIRIYN